MPSHDLAQKNAVAKPFTSLATAELLSTCARCSTGKREQSLVPQSRQFLVGDEPLATFSSPTGLFLGSDSPLPAPFPDSVLRPPEDLGHFVRRVKLLDGALLDQDLHQAFKLVKAIVNMSPPFRARVFDKGFN